MRQYKLAIFLTSNGRRQYYIEKTDSFGQTMKYKRGDIKWRRIYSEEFYKMLKMETGYIYYEESTNES